MTSQRLRGAVVGVGHLGQHHARILSELPGVELIAVADINRQVAEKISRKYDCRYETEHEKLTNDVDFVCIAVPTTAH
ncbi:Gfo/Idh/MocA family oxidoreductase, partial [bacterium]|nr:Gfo/Idh/MocA family oxidoreductase [candidate division CSSED10-310 bacterium]